MKKKLRKIKKYIYSHQADVLVLIISLILCIIGVLAISWITIPFIIAFDLVFIFWDKIYEYLNKIFKFKKKKKKKKEIVIDKDQEINKEIEKETINSDIKDNVLVEEGDLEVMAKQKKIKAKTKVKKEKKHKKKRKIWKILLLIVLIGIIIVFLGCIAFWMYIVNTSPKFDEDKLYKKESSILYDINGEEFAKLGSEFRTKITYEELPEVLVNAIIATEDSRFFQHNGFDLPRFIKASVKQVAKKLFGVGGTAGGASTLTMQIAKNAFNGSEDEGIEGIVRKFKDIYVSIYEIEQNYTKEQIIEFYVNSYCLGGNIYGVEQAALTYFHKEAKDLNLSEAAIIAGLFQAPNTYNPIRNPKNATYRRSIVLSLMVRHGYITQEEADAANAIAIEDLVVGTSTSSTDNVYQGFIDTVVNEVKEDTGKNPYTTPMYIYTTMDRTKQDIVNAAMSGQTYTWENAYVDAGVSVLDTQTGAIVAIGTGRDTSSDVRIDYATSIKKQIGSTAKPLYDYGPAVEYNNLSPTHYVGDEPYTYTGGTPITNWDGTYQGLITLRQALSGSRNIPALKVFQQVKNKNILEFVTNLGLSPEVSGGTIHEAHAIGGYNGESPLTISGAYAAFANGGTYNEPHSYTKLVYRDTNEEYENEYISRTAMKDSTAFILFDMLVTTSQEAMRGYRYINGWRYGAKTGTSNFTAEVKAEKGLASDAINDLWCTGVTDQYTISVWYGYNSINSNYYSHFGNSNHIILLRTLASQIWTRSSDVPQPSSVVSVSLEVGNYDEPKLPSKYTPSDHIATEYFVKGSEPTEVSTTFTQLSNPKNLKGTYANGSVTLSWDEIDTPDGLDQTYLKNSLKNLFTDTGWLNSAAQNRYNYFANTLGGIVYDVYQRVDGELTLVGTTAEDTIDIELTSSSSSITYVVKTSWRNYATCDSSGTMVTVKIDTSVPIVSLSLVGSERVEITKGSNYTTGIKVLANNVDVTTRATITYSIVDAAGTEVSKYLTSISSLDEGPYALTYTAKYGGVTKSITRTLIIK